jgi:hypothetical protein
MIWRTIGRIIGIVLILCALGLAVIFVSVLQTEGWRESGWILPVLVVIAVGLLLVGRYYFRMNPDAPEQPKSSTPFSVFLVNHRHQLKVLALTGFGLTLIALGAVCLGNQALWPLLPLGLGALVLRSLGNKIADPKILGSRDWQRVPAWLRGTFTPVKKTVDIAFLLTVLLTYWNLWYLWRPGSAPGVPGLRFVIQLVLESEIALLYGLESLFFEYGELRTNSPV